MNEWMARLDLTWKVRDGLHWTARYEGTRRTGRLHKRRHVRDWMASARHEMAHSERQVMEGAIDRNDAEGLATSAEGCGVARV